MAYTILKYLRVSSEDIDLDGFDKYESNSIVNQRAFIGDFIGRMPEFEGCTVIEECDDGWTGTNFNRPGVQKAIEMALSGKVQCIIVKDLSRWGRNFLEVGDYIEQKFPSWGVRIISINDVYDSGKLHGATGGIDIAFRNLVYEMYSHDLSEKIKSARLTAAKSGKFSAPYAFYGYNKDPKDQRKLVIDEESGTIVRRIFDLAAKKLTGTQIAKILNNENVPTPQQRQTNDGFRRRWTQREKQFWYSSMITKILTDERYTGKQIYGKMCVPEVGCKKRNPVPRDEWIVIPGTVPAIVTEDEYNAVREVVRGRYNSTYERSECKLLFSKKLKCGHCGIAMRVVRGKDVIKYKCSTLSLETGFGCRNEYVYEKDLAAAVLAALQQQIAFADDARKKLKAKAEQLAPSVEKLQADVTRLEKAIEKSKTAKMSLWEKYHAGTISAERFQHENEKADEQVVQYSAKIPELQERIRELELDSGRENVFVERFSKYVGIQELTRPVVEEFISEIKVYGSDRIEIVFNYADEYAKLAGLVNDTKPHRKAKGRIDHTGSGGQKAPRCPSKII